MSNMGDISNISNLSIIFMAVTAGLSILVPIVTIAIMGVKKRMNWKAMFIGAGFFVVFVIILESLLHMVVLGTDPSQSAIYKNPWLMMLYGGFAAGIFEETARLICFRFIVKVNKNESIYTGISYGLGHGGIEAIFIGGLAAVSNLIMSIMHNSGSLDTMTVVLSGEELIAFNQGIDIIMSTAPDMFLLSGLERMIALVLQISLSLFVLKAVADKKWWYFIYAILIHAGIDMFAVLYQLGIITNVYILIGIILVLTSVVTFFAFRFYNRDEAQVKG